MSERRFAVVSGFLGAGKTTTMIALANELKSRGVKTAIIANDLGASNLVDAAYTAKAGVLSTAIADGCICYKTDALVDSIRRFTDIDGAQLVLSDIPGCGVGALEHVYFRLHRDYPEDFTLAPFTVICDPLRLRAIMPEREDVNLPLEMDYLFRTQLLEADVIVLNKTDTISAGERDRCAAFLRAAYPEIPVLPVSAKTGDGIAALADCLMTAAARLTEVDTGYGGAEFMAAEARLSWYDRRFFLKKDGVFSGDAFLSEYIEAIRAGLVRRGRNVPHLKVFLTGDGGDFAKASLLGVDYDAVFDRRLEREYEKYGVIVNARAACESELLEEIMDRAMRSAAQSSGASCRVFATECFGMTEEGA
jgi:Ni2+-binding GTPase involved in maturation of urease and hydrogenase